jgi:2-methylisocitrate lyase-like PEP mutase family enzyme
MSAEVFRRLHETLLVLPNAWDVASARVMEHAGARAIATSSAAVAWSLGFRDGQRLPLPALVDVVRRMTRALHVPVSVDLEQGYAEAPEQVVDVVRQVVDAGAVGLNLEDAGQAPAVLCAKLEALRAAFPRQHLFLNARTCVVLRGAVRGEALVPEVLARARAFENAGADGVFVPGVSDPAALEALARQSLPLNVMASAASPSVSTLQALGVRRVSLGPRLAEVAWSAVDEATRHALAGDLRLATSASVTYPALEALFG